MILKKKLLAGCRLYLILDAGVLGYKDLFRVAKTAIDAGVDIVQLRDKMGKAEETLQCARTIRKLTGKKTLFIVNDRIDVAFLCGADGVHLGQEDLSISDARKILGKGAIVGRSCQTLKHLRDAEKEGADYVGFGSVFETLTKPGREPMDLGLLTKAVRLARVPLFPIGGITRKNVAIVIARGGRRVAVCRDILLDGNTVEAVSGLLNVLEQKKCSAL